MQLPDSKDLQAAAQRLAGVAHRTPVLRSRMADAACGAQLFFKCENLQRGGAFKFRGAYNAIAALPAASRAAGVVTYSSGNHAQAIALSASLLGAPACIVMPSDAPAAKLAATRGYGGEVVLYDRFRDDREEIGRQLARDRGLTLIPPYDHADVIAGAGTAALELFEEVGQLDVLLVIRIDVPQTLADGAQTQRLGDLNFAIIRQHAAGIVTVSDAALISAMRFFAERMKMVVEPTGALAAAAAFTGAVPFAGRRVGVIVSGGNVDLTRFAGLIAQPAPDASDSRSAVRA
jgi:threonine dehydratase